MPGRNIRLMVSALLLPGLMAVGVWFAITGFVRAAPAATVYPVATCNQAGFVAALALAQADPAGGIVTFPPCPVPALINLNVESTITGRVEISGAAHIFLRANNVRHFTVETGGVLTLTQVSLQNGTAPTHGGAVYVNSGGALVTRGALFFNNRTIQAVGHGGAVFATDAELRLFNSTFLSNTTTSYGGALYATGSELLVDNVRVQQNTASNTGGIYASTSNATVAASEFISNTSNAEGAGLHVTGGISHTGAVTVTDSLFRGNISHGQGGGANFTSNTFLVRDSVFTRNASNFGGGLRLANGAGTVERSFFISNTTNYTSGNGGGLNLVDADVTIQSSSFISNTSNKGAGLHITLGSSNTITPRIRTSTFAGNNSLDGSALHILKVGFVANPTAALIENSTFHHNGLDVPSSASIYAAKVPLTLSHLTITDSPLGVRATSTSTVTIANSILASDFSCGSDASSSVTIHYSLLSDDGCGTIGAGVILEGDPLLSPLQNNGGNTLTQLPAAGSPAIDSADSTTCLPTDQRGIVRPDGLGCDMGAVEASTIVLPTATHTPTPETPTPIATFPPDETETPESSETPSLTPEGTITPEGSLTPEASLTPDGSLTPEGTLTPIGTLSFQGYLSPITKP